MTFSTQNVFQMNTESAVLSVLFVIWPFGAFVLAFVMLSRKKLLASSSLCCAFILSLFWGLLAYSQKSLFRDGTDCIRYYASAEQFEQIPFADVLNNIELLDMVNYVFYPLSFYVVSLSGEVQTMSLFWTTFNYFVFYYSIYRLYKYYHCNSGYFFFLTIFVSTFCFMVFVQISELLKNASAFSLFFFALTLHIEKGWNKYVLLMIFASIGLHPSVLMLLPLFLYKHLDTRKLLILAVCFFPFAIKMNIFEYVLNSIPNGAYFTMLSERYDSHFEGKGSLHYVIIELLMLALAFWIWVKRGRTKNYACNIVCLYFIISSLNYVNLVAYLRFSIFSHFLFALLMIEHIRFYGLRFSKILKLISIAMLILTIRYSIGRTTAGGYASSYMDNSITKIVFSTSFDYWSVDYEK